MSYKKMLCCCGCGDGREILNESGGSNVSRGNDDGQASVANIEGAEESGCENRPVVSNPRNKCVLKPGHSYLNWVRLSNSKDLSGLGENAGKLEVTVEELAKHNKITDGWLAINGKVFNVTSYFPYHPGGVDELKKGLGIDATELFYEVHKWVNFDTILKSCFVGRLVSSPQKDAKETNLPEHTNQPPSPQKQTKDSPSPQPGSSTVSNQPTETTTDITTDDYTTTDENLFPRHMTEESPEIHSFRSTHEDHNMELTTSNFYNKYYNKYNNTDRNKSMPKFDWVQKFHIVCISFTIGQFSNPIVEAKRVEKAVHVTLCYDDKTVVNEVQFDHEVLWPCHVRVTEEDGKVELTFKKKEEALWLNYGILKQTTKMGCFSEDRRIEYVVKSKKEIVPNIFLVEVQRTDGVVIYVPVGYHLRVFAGIEGDDRSKSYTPIPPLKTLFPKPANATWGGDTIHLMVKRYENGNVSKYICDTPEGTGLLMSRPISPGFNLVRLHDKDRFICIAAGTGITPMLSLMLCMLQRRSRKCKRFATLFCNSNKENIPFLEGYKDLLKFDRNREHRISVKHIVTEPVIPEEPKFLKGRITIDHVSDAIEQIYTPRRGIDDDLFVFVCGPTNFNETCYRFLRELEVPDDQIFVFQG